MQYHCCACWSFNSISKLNNIPAQSVSPTVGKECPHLQVAAGQADDRGLVQLGGDGSRKRQQLGKLIKLSVLLLSSRLCGVLAFLLHFCKFPAASLRPFTRGQTTLSPFLSNLRIWTKSRSYLI